MFFAVVLLYKVKEVKGKNAELAEKDKTVEGKNAELAKKDKIIEKITEKIKAQNHKQAQEEVIDGIALNRLFEEKPAQEKEVEQKVTLTTAAHNVIDYVSSGVSTFMPSCVINAVNFPLKLMY